MEYAKSRTYRDILRHGFAFASSNNGRLLIQFYFVMRTGRHEILGGRAMDFETDSGEIEAILRLIFRLFYRTSFRW